ncbi:MAG: hypothetical protein AAF717_02680 [Bacteroidota bacterium]
MKKHIVWVLLGLLHFGAVKAQYVIKTGEELENLKQLPQEKVYLNHTGPILFSGEYLYYSFYCFNAQNSRLSTISKVGYVALVNENKEYVLEQKLKLEQGLGQGDFFVTTDLPSGTYKILGYTQWMKNNGLEQVFKEDIVIINPYMADQSPLLTAEDTPADEIPKDVGVAQSLDSSTVNLAFDKQVYTTRDKVSLSLRNYKGNLGNGVYTIKVKKRDISNTGFGINAMKYARDYLNVGKQLALEVGDSLFLPEQRGELFFGSVRDKASGTPVDNLPVVVSLPGKEFVLKFATTDQAGNFYTYLRKDYKLSQAVIQTEGEEVYDIQVKSPKKLDVSPLRFTNFALQEEWDEAIRQRSVYNQIENQYFSLKPDSLLLGDPIDPFDGGIPEIFVLDDYTRFPTFRETLVEILNNAGYRNNPEGNDYIRIAQDFEKSTEIYNDFPAIVLFDGVFIPNHETVKEFDARTIKLIAVQQDQFQLAGKEYQGILAVETFDGNFYEEHLQPNAIQAPIVKPLTKKNYYRQTYGQEEDPYARIPDYRTVLFWEPHITVASNTLDFEFFTSDIRGEYDVFLDGFTSYGKPISVVTSISVK